MRRVIFSALALGVVSVCNADELFFDAIRQYSNSFDGLPFVKAGPVGPFLPGFVEITGQNLLYCEPDGYGGEHLLRSYWKRNQGNSLPEGSMIGWNTSAAQIVKDGRTYAAGGVTVHNIDRIPAIDYLCKGAPGAANSVGLYVKVQPLSGASTPGRLLLLSRSAGAWSTIYDLPITGVKTDDRTLNLTANTRLRWVVVKNGGSTADVSAILSIRAEPSR